MQKIDFTLIIVCYPGDQRSGRSYLHSISKFAGTVSNFGGSHSFF